MSLELVSEDERRKLYEFGKGREWKVAKYLVIEKDCKIGSHYHKNKDELFLVVAGEIDYKTEDVDPNRKYGFAESGWAKSHAVIYVPRNTYHVFDCKAGTVIIGLATELHDDSDDYKL